MKNIPLTLFAIVLSTGAFARSNPFERLQSQFQRASVPSQKETVGYWAGHCVQAQEPDKRWPAVYLSRMVIDPASAFTESYSQTYFWERRNTPDFFMGFTAEQLNQYSPYRDWVQKEQWLPSFIEDDSLTNEFQLSNGSKVIRSVRINETEFTLNYLMQVVWRTSKGDQIVSYCSFSKELEVTSAGETSPTFKIQTGFLADTYAEIRLPSQVRAMKALVVRKKSGEAFTLSRLEITQDTGRIMYFAPTYFENDNAIGFTQEGQQPFRAASIRFYLSGAVSDLEIYGEP